MLLMIESVLLAARLIDGFCFELGSDFDLPSQQRHALGAHRRAGRLRLRGCLQPGFQAQQSLRARFAMSACHFTRGPCGAAATAITIGLFLPLETSQPPIEPVEFAALLARGRGEPVGLTASEIPPARRQIELRHAPRRSAILEALRRDWCRLRGRPWLDRLARQLKAAKRRCILIPRLIRNSSPHVTEHILRHSWTSNPKPESRLAMNPA